jgi:hypothetical protein
MPLSWTPPLLHWLWDTASGISTLLVVLGVHHHTIPPRSKKVDLVEPRRLIYCPANYECYRSMGPRPCLELENKAPTMEPGAQPKNSWRTITFRHQFCLLELLQLAWAVMRAPSHRFCKSFVRPSAGGQPDWLPRPRQPPVLTPSMSYYKCLPSTFRARPSSSFLLLARINHHGTL